MTFLINSARTRIRQALASTRPLPYADDGSETPFTVGGGWEADKGPLTDRFTSALRSVMTCSMYAFSKTAFDDTGGNRTNSSSYHHDTRCSERYSDQYSKALKGAISVETVQDVVHNFRMCNDYSHVKSAYDIHNLV